MNKDLVGKKQEIKYSNMIKQYKNVSLWLYYKRRDKRTKSKLAENSYRILTVVGSRYGKIDTLLNLINHEQDTNKICLYANDPYEAKYQLIINKRESAGLKCRFKYFYRLLKWHG